jgi:2'-5' RNA ligase
MTSPGSVGGDERLRLFLAYTLPGPVVDVLVAWQERELAGSSGRRVPPGNLHVTLAFLGSRPAGELPAILGVLAEAAAGAAPPLFQPVSWRETRAAGMLVLEDRAAPAATALAGRVQSSLAELGVYRPENRDWLPHLTVLRYRRPPKLRPPLPELEPFVPSGAAAFLSRLHPSGARYEVLQSFSLGG